MKKKGDIKRNTFSKNYRGQVWIETVIYLLIAFVMMGLVLSYVKPKIEDLRDKAIIEQSLDVINEIDNTISTIGSTGNKRLIEIGVKKGVFNIDSENDMITFELETKYQYSEFGKEVYIGKVKAITQGQNQYSKVILTRDFSEEYNLIYDSSDTNKALPKASTPYRVFIENKGVGVDQDKLIINFNIE
ncbi:MAG: hypothetical protein BWY36_00835 [Candidatus Diapherotrites archaeon ADurb.Bin253]|jgi:hypothetical protein|nr:hypothetical protein [Candidatus Pacearchaeota archaeon]OQA66887.1 MAG: hypothetical protein BWY36_00835 [Candidatus Diapherotrites archaeon ADurb.Bin253]HNZ52100.1 hypothetical protein [Candidatus Pacearchaeota archaeon]HOF44326.1 hypothetical protein [Candidatus Pacearchaeota archaeon]HOR52639.1 hypothetical protein [Candidatus Pacearchaeota archaeon]